jgi:hypothetical protein
VVGWWLVLQALTLFALVVALLALIGFVVAPMASRGGITAEVWPQLSTLREIAVPTGLVPLDVRSC